MWIIDVELLWVVAVFLASVVLLRWARASRAIWLTAAAVGICTWLLFTPAVSTLALLSLETNHQSPANAEGIDYVVVLSGGMIQTSPGHEELADDSLYRCLHAAHLWKANPEKTLLLSGGLLSSERHQQTLAAAMRTFLVDHGVSADKILLEERSTTTYENAKYCADMLSDLGSSQAILITDAYHMPRAQRCFETQGIQVSPSTSRRVTTGSDWSWQSFVPRTGSTRGLQRALHEWVGLAWYKFRGYL